MGPKQTKLKHDSLYTNTLAISWPSQQHDGRGNLVGWRGSRNDLNLIITNSRTLGCDCFSYQLNLLDAAYMDNKPLGCGAFVFFVFVTIPTDPLHYKSPLHESDVTDSV